MQRALSLMTPMSSARVPCVVALRTKTTAAPTWSLTATATLRTAIVDPDTRLRTRQLKAESEDEHSAEDSGEDGNDDDQHRLPRQEEVYKHTAVFLKTLHRLGQKRVCAVCVEWGYWITFPSITFTRLEFISGLFAMLDGVFKKNACDVHGRNNVCKRCTCLSRLNTGEINLEAEANGCGLIES